MIKYKKISFDYLIKQLNNNNKLYVDFINLYIKEYLYELIHINNTDDFIKYNKNYLEKYKKVDNSSKIIFHLLINKEKDKIIGIEKTLKISDGFFKLKYFTPLKQEYKIPDNSFIYYAINLYVSPEYRGQKLCNKILKMIQKTAIKKNIKFIISEIHNDNIPSIKCHLSSNFIKTDILSYKDSYFYIALL